MTRGTRLDLLFGALALLTLAGAFAAWAGGAFASAFGLFSNSVQMPLLALACACAVRSGRLLEAGAATRPAWLLLAAGLSVFLAAESLDAWHEVVERTGRPFPSAADLLFVCGYLFIVPALFRFIRVYRASGFDVGSTAEHVGLAAAGSVAAAAVGYGPLRSILASGAPVGERLLGVTYPLLDFTTLILALVLLRIALAFRGGQVWRVWGLLLLGFAFTCAADVMFAFLSAGGIGVQRPFMEALYVLSYVALARGTLYQYEMLAG
jgi:hypothetical protein